MYPSQEMKIGTALFALFILTAFSSHLPSAAAELVDTDGQPLRNGGIYYILPLLIIRGGGITQAETGNDTCPATVVQSSAVFSKGLPVQISSPAKILYLHGGLSLDLEFAAFYVCPRHTPKWTVADDGLPHGPSVKLVGSKNSVDGGFKIRPVGLGGYKLVFCATPADTCSDIGVWVDPDGVWRLVVSDKIDPLAVVFQNSGLVPAAAA